MSNEPRPVEPGRDITQAQREEAIDDLAALFKRLGPPFGTDRRDSNSEKCGCHPPVQDVDNHADARLKRYAAAIFGPNPIHYSDAVNASLDAAIAVADKEIAEAELQALRAAAARLYTEFPADPEIGAVIDPDRRTLTEGD